jgi:hypothetical protein
MSEERQRKTAFFLGVWGVALGIDARVLSDACDILDPAWHTVSGLTCRISKVRFTFCLILVILPS